MTVDFFQTQNSTAFAYAVSLFLGTFVLEDLAAIGAGLLLASGSISWPLAFVTCFLGIWSGDAGLYALARCGGRRWFECSRFQHLSAKVNRSEEWFANRGTMLLVFSRMIPGARLPTYLAAGFLRLQLGRFLLVTGVATLTWTIFVLVISRAAGSQVLKWFATFKNATWFMLICLILIWASVWLVSKFFTPQLRRRISATFGRLRRWEFWPAWAFYPPAAFCCMWLAIKYRSLRAPMLANPGIFSGGIVGESKIATLLELQKSSPKFTAQAELVAGSSFSQRVASLQQIRQCLNISFPFILKPDVGQRGAGVKLIRSNEQAEAYFRKTSAPLLVQQYVPGPFEVGIFYYRFPHESHGHIFAITQKIFPVVIGNGHSTISELIWDDSRARFLANKYLTRFKGRENEVLAVNHQLKLVEAGNHAEGCIFRDGMHLLTPTLADRIDEISKNVSGFFVGRYDIRFPSLDDLQRGENFQIVELNGAASEATSIYDAKNSVFAAYRTLFRQWDIVFAIGAANRNSGISPTPLATLWRAWRDYSRVSATYPSTD